jgi:hypothetical protein
MFLDLENYWESETFKISPVPWEEIYGRESLSELIKRAVSEGFRKEH